MTTESEKLSTDFVDQLTDLQRDGSSGDVAFLNRTRDALEKVLEASAGDEAAVRALLAERRASGELRDETYELVKSMLDRYRTEQLSTAGDPATAEADGSEDSAAFDQTMVIDTRAFPREMRAERQLQVGSVLRDRFLLKEQVSGGSMGVVFKALDRRLAETGEGEPFVAIKVLAAELSDDPKALRLLQQEAAKGRFLSHNNIVRFVDLDRDDDLYFIIMEWLDGENLADTLDRSDKLDVERALKITRDIGEALDYAHNRGIVHADIKPANIMIQPDGNAKLFDFGVARVRQEQLDTSSSFDPGLPGALTPAYSSMQVLTGEEPIAEDDVFSLACLMYRLIAGYRVFGPRNAAEAAEAGMTPQPLQGLTDRQWKALKKALAFSRVARFSSVREFLNELQDEPDEELAITVDRTGRFTVEPEESPSRLPMIAVILAILAGGAWFAAPYVMEELGGGQPVELALIDEPLDAGIEEQPIESPDDAIATVESTSPAENSVDSDSERPSDVVDAPSEIDATAVEATDSTVVEAEASDDELVIELPPGDVQVVLDGSSITLELTEDDAPLTVDLEQIVPADFERTVRIVEGEFTGNRSPLDSGELQLDVAQVVFTPGSERQQVVLSMASDPVREADQQTVLEVRDENDNTKATITVLLRDDDQRRFERSLPPDTVAFASGQASVLEQEAAVQIDVIRFKPSNETLSVAYTVSDVTATSDEDYFAPRDSFVFFEAGQRSARILIPLVQDSVVEGNEAFVIELLTGNALNDSDIYQRVAVFIRDDD